VRIARRVRANHQYHRFVKHSGDGAPLPLRTMRSLSQAG
jgi:hypothetical protein